MASIADVYVTVLPEVGKLADGIKRALRDVDSDARAAGRRWAREIEAGLRDVDIEIKADTTKAKAEIKAAAEDQKATIEVDADTASAETKIDVAARDRKATIEVDVDKDRLGAVGMQAGVVLGQAVSQGATAAMGAATDAAGGLSKAASSAGAAGAMGAVGIAALGAACVGLASVAAAASGALLLIPAAVGGLALGAGTLMVGFSGITDALTAVSGAQKTAGKDAASHAAAVRSANSSVVSATRSMNSAIRSEQQAQKDVARARKEARQELEDINDELRNGAIDETQARLDLAKAQEELATGQFESSLDYQQAQLNVIRAEQRLGEAHKDNIRLDEDAIDKRAKGVEGSDQVVAANERLAAAQESTAGAIQSLADAQQRLTDTQNESSSAAEKASEAMAGLSPGAQAFVNTLIGLKPVWDEFKNSIQDALFANLGPQLTATVDALLPAIQPGLTRIAGAFNQMFQNAMTWLQDPKNLAMIEGIVNNIATAFEKLAPAIGPLLTAFTTLTSVGAGFLPQLAEALTAVVTQFSEWITKSAESGQLEQLIQTGLDTIAALLPMLPAIMDMFAALIPLGVMIAPILTDVVVGFAWLVDGFVAGIQHLVSMVKFGWDNMTGTIKFFWDWVKSFFEWIADKFAHFLPDSFVQTFTNAFTTIKTVVQTFWDWIKGFFADIATRIAGLLPQWVINLLPGGGAPVPAPPGSGSANTPANNAPTPVPPQGPAPTPPAAAPGTPAPLPPAGPAPAPITTIMPATSTTSSTTSGSSATAARQPYGLAAGTDVRQGATGFPQWVYDLAAQFNLTASTYAGHQEGTGQNQGIDWWGTNEDLQRFADYLVANPQLAEQVIFYNEATGVKTGMAGGQRVGPGTSQPGYYRDDWSGHTKHVHTRFSMSATGGGVPAPDSHTIALDPNIPAGQTKAKGAAKGAGEQLGQDIITGMMEVFGFGDLFKDPTEFGIFKLFEQIMKIPAKMLKGAKPAGATGGDPLAGGTAGGGGGLTDFVTGLIPAAPGQGGAARGAIDNSLNVNIGHTGSNADEVIDQIYGAQAAFARPALRNVAFS